MVWLYFGRTSAEDVAVLQEVKTTHQPELEIAYKIKADYEKLFGSDPSLTLKSRLSGIKNRIELEMRQPELAKRVNKFLCFKPSLCSSIFVLPSLIYDCELAARELVQDRMATVRTSIAGLGWDNRQIESWAVAIEKLADRMSRLATGT